MRTKATLGKYLARYAESTGRLEIPSQMPGYESALVIPAFNESASFLLRVLANQSMSTSRLVVVVVNHPEGATREQRLRSGALIDGLVAQDRCWSLAPGVLLVEGFRDPEDLVHLCVIDATAGSLQLRVKEGVGRARKMGIDLCARLYERGKLRSRYVGSSDADVCLPSSYFETLEETTGGHAALLFPYKHVPCGEPVVDEAMRWVEAGFRYYVLGLARAGSPSAYHSLGSALAVSLDFYAQVRGVPNRQAGEDFYLLSKLGKLGALHRITTDPIEIQTRLSDRVPFGTGPSTRRAEDTLETGGAVETYCPQVFELLGQFIEALELAAESYPSSERFEEMVLEARTEWFRLRLRSAAKELQSSWASSPSAHHRRQKFHERFDALATLQFIHEAERNGLARWRMVDALREILSLPDASVTELLEALQDQEAALLPEVGWGARIMKG